MSRTKIFSILFLVLALGSIEFVFLYQQWTKDFEKNFLQSQLSGAHNASAAVVRAFQLEQLHAATREASKAKALLAAYQQSDEKKRQDAAHDALKALKASFKGAAFVAATDDKGNGFASSQAAGWKADWSGVASVKAAVGGQGGHGIAPFKKSPHIFIAVPLTGLGAPAKSGSSGQNDQDNQDDKNDKTKPNPRRKAPVRRPPARRKGASGKNLKCGPGTYKHCFWKCLKRAPKKKGQKRGKCKKWTKPCYCRKGKPKPRKRGSLQPLMGSKRLAQSADDDSSTAAPKPAPKPKLLGALVVGFALGDALASAIKKSTGLDVGIFSPSGTLHGGTLKGKERAAFATLLKGKDGGDLRKRSGAALAVKVAPKTYLAASKSLAGGKAGVALLRSTAAVDAMTQRFVMMFAGAAGICFFLALFLLLPAASRVQREIEELDEQVLDAYNTGNLNVSFNESASGSLGPFAATLNRLFQHLSSGPAVQNPVEAGWGAPAPASAPAPAPARKAPRQAAPAPTPEPAPAPKPEPAAPAPKPAAAPAPAAPAPAAPAAQEESDEPSRDTGELITHFLMNPSAHYEEVYTRYRSAKEQVGEDVSRLKKDKFIEKLRKNAETYVNKYDCRGVLFDVTVKDDKVILKPQLIPKE